ncbi:MAG: DUF3857 domain-containing protein [Caldithrix sp.]|nr:DUF3857 domain-containing protein [Caldithrix sp.]
MDNIETEIYDLEGRHIKELDDDDIEESTISPGFILYQKNKHLWIDLKHHQYPYILSIRYEMHFESIFFWPSWRPQPTIPVQYSQYKLIQDDPLPFHYHTISDTITPERSVEDGDSVYVWARHNIPAKEKEDFIPPENRLQQAVIFAPGKFELGDSHGNFADWDAFGAWYRQLTWEKYHLPQALKNKIHQLIRQEDNPYGVASALYRFLQQNTRYVAIYLDIGGWEPHDAGTVYRNRYGDCKDLTTLMIAMLRYADIQAYPALVQTRDQGVVYPDFVANQFNHVIAFVPLPEDTLWLECTADFIDITDMPASIEDANVLVVKNRSDEIIRTPQAPMDANTWSSHSTLKYKAPGSLSIASRITCKGKQKHGFKSLFARVTPTNEKILLQKIFGKYLPNFTLADYDYREEGQPNQRYVIEIDGLYKNAVTHTVKRIFINPNILNRKTMDHFPDDENRQFAVHIDYPYRAIDTLDIALPYGYTLESAPEPLSLDFSFAHYKTSYSFEDRKLHCIRDFAYKKNHIEQDHYRTLQKFLRKVIKNDDTYFIFKQ